MIDICGAQRLRLVAPQLDNEYGLLRFDTESAAFHDTLSKSVHMPIAQDVTHAVQDRGHYGGIDARH